MIEKRSNPIFKTFIWVVLAIVLTAIFFVENNAIQMILMMLLPPLGYSAFLPFRISWLFLGPVTDLVFYSALKNMFLNKDFQQLGAVLIVVIIAALAVYVVTEFVFYKKRLKDTKPFFKEISEAKLQTGPLVFNEAALQDSQMTESEQEFFRSEMKKYHKKYEYLCNVDSEIKLMLPTYSEDMKVMDGIFRELLNAPVQLLSASDFLYQDLPDYVNLVRATENVLDNVIKEADDKKVLSEVPDKIALISTHLQKDFKKITDNEREELKKQLRQVQIIRNRID